ncbi:translation initiation factor IF-2 subunit beta [Candidatus Pacearchaeota archaeon]|nr:translation initiation factor IF-2 subunit beta [Candidatus Pacearchaeota archaeon]|tara:strand:+ start:168 stop:575 length:408 start_codon:yes stop_codon:yes gene_type:complete
MDYNKLLDKAYKEVKVVSSSSGRFEIPKVQGQVQGKNTIITNISEIAQYLRRPIEHISKFLQKELAAAGKIQNNRLVLNAKINSSKVNEKIESYAKEFVICPVCGKPDTELNSEKGIKSKHCLACGANSPIKYHL